MLLFSLKTCCCLVWRHVVVRVERDQPGGDAGADRLHWGRPLFPPLQPRFSKGQTIMTKRKYVLSSNIQECIVFHLSWNSSLPKCSRQNHIFFASHFRITPFLFLSTFFLPPTPLFSPLLTSLIVPFTCFPPPFPFFLPFLPSLLKNFQNRLETNGIIETLSFHKIHIIKNPANLTVDPTSFQRPWLL